MDSPPAIHVSVPAPPQPAIDYDRVIRCILELEGTPWSKPGGALCFQPGTWQEETSLPYRLASNSPQARIVAKQRLARFAALAISHGLTPTPRYLLDVWRFPTFALHNLARDRSCDYAQRGANLFNDPTFK